MQFIKKWAEIKINASVVYMCMSYVLIASRTTSPSSLTVSLSLGKVWPFAWSNR